MPSCSCHDRTRLVALSFQRLELLLRLLVRRPRWLPTRARSRFGPEAAYRARAPARAPSSRSLIATWALDSISAMRAFARRFKSSIASCASGCRFRASSSSFARVLELDVLLVDDRARLVALSLERLELLLRLLVRRRARDRPARARDPASWSFCSFSLTIPRALSRSSVVFLSCDFFAPSSAATLASCPRALAIFSSSCSSRSCTNARASSPLPR